MAFAKSPAMEQLPCRTAAQFDQGQGWNAYSPGTPLGGEARVSLVLLHTVLMGVGGGSVRGGGGGGDGGWG